MKEKYLKTLFTYKGSAVGFRCDRVELPNRRHAQREYLTHPGAVAIIPFLDSPREKPLLRCRVVMVEQYRYPVNRLTVELPAGKIDKGESARACLARELQEETGYSSKTFHPLLSYWPTPAFSNELIHIFWTDRLKDGTSSPDDDEFLRVKVLAYGKVLEKVRRGEIRDSKTVIAVLAAPQFILK